ncbi:MAG: polysaccharide deacetylase family protein [Gammaproteobacteria bacterium]|nr:polysaccharide deacetylase family protein [Gammaproteobacteria bacterium]
MSETKGIFTISLDFELYWGMQDKYPLAGYKDNLDGVEPAIKKILAIFDQYGVHATWATVGMLFAKNVDELKKHYPDQQPHYTNNKLNPYRYIEKNNHLDHRYHFAPELIDLISSYQGQEIASHTFSHYYCLEHGQSKDDFRADMWSAVAIAATNNIKLTSLVFPRNQWNNNYLSILTECGIDCFRGNEKSWLYRASNTEHSKLFKRATRLIDSYINLSGQNCYSLAELSGIKPYNIPSSRFLRPFTRRLSLLEGLRKNRIKQAMKYAAKNGQVFHLWWHPHNFGINIDENLLILDDLLQHYKKMNEQFGMQALNMGEISELLDSVK